MGARGRGFTSNLLYLHMEVASSILCCLWCQLHACFIKLLLCLFSYLSSVLPSLNFTCSFFGLFNDKFFNTIYLIVS